MASSIRTLNPATGKIEKEFQAYTSEEINQYIDDANELYQTWRFESFEERKAVMKRVANEMRKQKARLAALITTEMGKPLYESEIEIDYSANIIEYYADNAEEFLANVPIQTEKGDAYVVSEPIGVLLGVMPWNFPFSQIARFAGPHIMAGNTVVLKTASNIPQCGIAFEEMFTAAGAPKGLYKNLLMSGKDTDSIINNPKIVGVSLTGSEAAGAEVASIAGKNVKPSVLELGGSDPMIVLNDADIEKVMNGTINGRLRNAGQACTSSKRIIVQEGIYDEYLKKITDYINGMKVGDPTHADTNMGPVSSESALEKLLDQINDSANKGATIVSGGKRIDRDGFFLQPTILTDLKPGMKAYDEEVFGPVVCIWKVKDVEEAIKIANDTPYGLGASIYTEDVPNAEKIARRIDSGMVYVNKQVSSSPDLPFGGVKHSGYGRELSKAGIMEFINKKLIMIAK
ncbi:MULTISPECIES: NAD-dependent succinate-semialdehyde dehydrogenase [Empedobacter]|uniref:NAD-dependent succinate-semialdehyde dehydrogenase n=1 Tax=Empedobacter TaxID=59734 RepID=UPI000E8D2C13|nr:MULTISPECIES: NAD-dependent succinate-semialdehyde dehydrogenase [Empedobacter]MBW1618906.1 NAD-dependent succinate-semialdehyde dehydrogenase [Empedobacter falsenii]MBY0067548.1 NAD-dependent succinate-semialdehyde dehydrogenase [Empedobacter falsenii]MDM1138995.1 NAD-dependent succinate-semialdehyde dehydrogenase [Empedobacter sp. R132-2]HBX63130.1 succinate-semialdehyde dehydrogenase [Flavobacteriaceae bacterium]